MKLMEFRNTIYDQISEFKFIDRHRYNFIFKRIKKSSSKVISHWLIFSIINDTFNNNYI